MIDFEYACRMTIVLEIPARFLMRVSDQNGLSSTNAFVSAF